MALTPGSGLPKRPRSGANRSPDGPARPASVFRWGILIGGLVAIVDLLVLLAIQRTGLSEDDLMLQLVNNGLNALLYWFLGSVVYRETGRVSSGATAGVIAGLLDGTVIGAARALMGPMGDATGQPLPPDQVFLGLLIQNVLLGMVLAALSAWFARNVRRPTGA